MDYNKFTQFFDGCFPDFEKNVRATRAQFELIQKSNEKINIIPPSTTQINRKTFKVENIPIPLQDVLDQSYRLTIKQPEKQAILEEPKPIPFFDCGVPVRKALMLSIFQQPIDNKKYVVGISLDEGMLIGRANPLVYLQTC